MSKPILIIFICSIFYLLSFDTDSETAQACQHAHLADYVSNADSAPTNIFPSIPESLYDSIFNKNQDFISRGFDFPVGKPDALDYYKAQQFGENNHLGEDWNGKGGGNTDLGDPVYTCADGLVTFTEDVCCGWGNVVRIIHKLPNHPKYKYVETVYAHMHHIDVKVGDLVKRGDQIGAIGTANGRYSAHLHFEMRDFINMSLGPGYSEDHFGYLKPTDFIEQNRP